MMRGVFVTGTDTDVGKTYVACLLARYLSNNNITVIPRKPAESGCKIQDGKLLPADALALKQSAAFAGDLFEICQFRFHAALSPVRSAQLENKKVSIEQLTHTCKQAKEDDFLLVEGAGGFYSPLAYDGLNADLAVALQLPILLIAEDRLGCINQILLSAEAIENRGLKLAAVVLNIKEQASDHNMNNADDLRDQISVPTYTVRHKENNDAALADLSEYLLSL